jgi:hypothetical protein
MTENDESRGARARPRQGLKSAFRPKDGASVFTSALPIPAWRISRSNCSTQSREKQQAAIHSKRWKADDEYRAAMRQQERQQAGERASASCEEARAGTMRAGRVSGTRPAHIIPQPRRFLPGVIKQLFQEVKQALRPASGPQPRRKSRRSGDTQNGFKLAAAQLRRIARTIMDLTNFTFHPPPELDEGQRIHLWHQNNQDGAFHEAAAYHPPEQNYLSLHL